MKAIYISAALELILDGSAYSCIDFVMQQVNTVSQCHIVICITGLEIVDCINVFGVTVESLKVYESIDIATSTNSLSNVAMSCK